MSVEETGTPRTDVVACFLSSLSANTSEQYVLAQFARTLERELASGDAIRHAEKKILIDEIAARTETKAALSAATAENARLREQLEPIQSADSWAGLCQERDALRAEVKQLKAAYDKAAFDAQGLELLVKSQDAQLVAANERIAELEAANVSWRMLLSASRNASLASDLRATGAVEATSLLEHWGVLYNTPPLLVGDEWVAHEKAMIVATVDFLSKHNANTALTTLLANLENKSP